MRRSHHVLVLAGLVAAVAAAVASRGQEEGDKLIEHELYLDMFYGTDDYFGENTDLGYSDRATPAGSAAGQASAEQTSTTTGGQTAGGGTTGGGTTPTDIEPIDDTTTEPPEPPPT